MAQQVFIVARGVDAGRALSLDGTTAVIGRDPVHPVVLSDPRVSRSHATLTVQEGLLLIADEGSLSGTAVNGVRIDRPTPLRVGDTVQVGDSELRVLWAPEPAATVIGPVLTSSDPEPAPATLVEPIQDLAPSAPELEPAPAQPELSAPPEPQPLAPPPPVKIPPPPSILAPPRIETPPLEDVVPALAEQSPLAPAQPPAREGSKTVIDEIPPPPLLPEAPSPASDGSATVIEQVPAPPPPHGSAVSVAKAERRGLFKRIFGRR